MVRAKVGIYTDEPFGFGRFATGTHPQRALWRLLVSCIIILGASWLDA